MALTPFYEWPEVYQDSDVEIRRNPQDPEEYGLTISKNKFRPLIMPRGTFLEIARGDREHGRNMLKTLDGELLKYFYDIVRRDRGRMPETFHADFLLSAIKTAYITEQEKYQEWKDSQKD